MQAVRALVAYSTTSQANKPSARAYKHYHRLYGTTGILVRVFSNFLNSAAAPKTLNFPPAISLIRQENYYEQGGDYTEALQPSKAG